MNLPSGPGIRCAELVEQVTDYLDGVLDPDRREAIEAHLRLCEPCAIYLEQMRATISMLGYLPVEHAERLPDDVRDQMLAAFRAQGPP